MLREWRSGGTATPPTTPAASRTLREPSRAGALVGRAVAGSVWSRLGSEGREGNEALAISYTELELNYRKAEREKELRYAPPDTTRLILQCRA